MTKSFRFVEAGVVLVISWLGYQAVNSPTVQTALDKLGDNLTATFTPGFTSPSLGLNSDDDSSNSARNAAPAVPGASTPPTPGMEPDDKNKRDLTSSEQKSIRSYEKRIAEHQKKLEEFKNNPTVKPGMEKLPADIIKAQQATRIKHLETEIKTFTENIKKILDGLKSE